MNGFLSERDFCLTVFLPRYSEDFLRILDDFSTALNTQGNVAKSLDRVSDGPEEGGSEEGGSAEEVR